MKYKQLKTIRAETILSHKPPKRDFSTFVDHFGYEPVDVDDLLKFGGLGSCWITWLIDHGFIEETKEEKIYGVGQLFTVERGYDASRYKLRCHSLYEKDYYAGLFSEEYETDWVGVMVSVKDRLTITSQNIRDMIPEYTWTEANK